MERQGRGSLPSHESWVSISANSCSTKPEKCTHVKDVDVNHLADRCLADVPYLSKQTCRGYICQHEIYSGLARQFVSCEDAHGAINTRVLLWGLGGHGKRELSTHFANSLALAHNKKILWVEGNTAVTFIRDLRLAYELMTGKFHPSGVSVRWQLYRISRALSQCKSKWLMVIFDLHPDLQSSTQNETRVDLASYLPDGQILMTYSPRTRVSPDKSLSIRQVQMEFPTRDIISRAQIATYDSKFVRLLIDPPKSSSQEELQYSERSLKRSSRHLLAAALGSSIARATHCTLDHFHQCLDLRNSPDARKRPHSTSPTSLLIAFGSTMQMLLEFLRDTNIAAELLLIALAPACPRDVPTRLLRKLKIFRENVVEVDNAIELLQSISVLQVRKLHNGETFIDLHHMIHSWLYTRFKGTRFERETEFRVLTRQWVDVLDQDLPDLLHETDKQKYWLLLHLTQCVTKNAEMLDFRCPSLVSLLRKIATFMSDFLVTPLEANRLLARALYLTANMNSEEDGFNIEVERLKLHCERSRLCALLGDHQQARQEVGHAQTCMDALEGSNIEKTIPYNLRDELIELLLRQGSRLQAKAMIVHILASETDIPAERKGRLHYWAVCCAGNDPISQLEALQHSHQAMSFWHSLPEDERWGSKSFSMVAWVDAHADTLLQMDRGRGALIFMPKLLDHYIEQCPPTTEAIWRVACCLVREYINTWELEAAEDVCCRVLSICDFSELEGASLAWALTMLHAVGAIFARTGRYVESEGVIATCLGAIENHKPPRTTGEGAFSSPNMWLELCHTLLVQGKLRQAEAARNLALQRGFNNLSAGNWREIALEPRRNLLRAYSRVLEAAHDRNDNRYNPDDFLLDTVWPKTFSVPIQVLGDPFERIKNGLDEIEDVSIPTGDTVGEFSKILALLGYHFTSDESDTSSHDSDDDPLWQAAFRENLTVLDTDHQSRMWDYWRWCDCRRKRTRTKSVSYNSILHNKILIRDDASKKASEKLHVEIDAQTRITKYFRVQKKYPASLCPPDCPCVEMNLHNDTPISQIEGERLYVYRSPNIIEREAKHAAYLYSLREYRYRFGPRPAVPFGMSFATRWRRPKGPSEPNGSAKKQHEFLWAPDFVFAGDSESNWGFLGQDENYLFTNPAMLIRSNGAKLNSLPDLPNIVVTAYELGVEVRGNIDLFDVKGRKKWTQTNIKDYLLRADDSDDTDTEGKAGLEGDHSASTQQPPLPPSTFNTAQLLRPARRRGRKAQRKPRPASRSSSASSSTVRSRTASPSAGNQAPNIRQALPRPDTLKLFSLNSLGSVFDVADFNKETFKEMKMKLPAFGVDDASSASHPTPDIPNNVGPPPTPPDIAATDTASAELAQDILASGGLIPTPTEE